MADSLVHRGPDDEGFWHDRDIALGFRRLSIVDLETGRQPMSNEDGTTWVVFNGEIYNHRELRKVLEQAGHRFSSDHSDTEVIVHGYEEWGLDMLERLNGMFAFALWDQRLQQLLLARDRLGIKPLYYSDALDDVIVFGSEIRAIHASGLIDKAPDDAAVYAYFLQQNLWDGRSMFRGVKQLLGGHVLLDQRGQRTVRQYWDVSFRREMDDPGEAAKALKKALEGAIHRQMAADVPVATYLSGGIDSSALTAGARRIDSEVKAFSCVFDLCEVGEDRVVDEREFARAVATHLRLQHVELELPQDSLASALHCTIDALEEPRMGMAYVNYLIAKRVALESKVVLSGCGGDEIMGGYVARYAHINQPYQLDRTSDIGWFNSILRRRTKTPAIVADPARRILELYNFPISDANASAAFEPHFLKSANGYTVGNSLQNLLGACPSDCAWDKLMYADAKTYLSGLLMVEDKLSMAHSLESRVPLLDNELIDLCFTFDWNLLCDGLTGKKVFRDAIRDWVPAVVADKPKMGFGPPDASWYRGVLQPWIRKILSSERISARGVFRAEYIGAVVEDHMAGKSNMLPLIWSLLSFDAWCEINGFYGGNLGRPFRLLI